MADFLLPKFSSMKTIISHPISIPHQTTLLKPTFFPIFSSSPFNPSHISKCTSDDRENGGLKDVLSGMVDKRVEQLLKKEENRVLLDGLEKASLRVETARRELAEIERQELEALQFRNYVSQLQKKEAEVAECQKEILEARAMVEEAECSLSNNITPQGNGESNKEQERWESIKAASVSALVGSLAGLPVALSQVSSGSELVLPLAITFVSCALFGVTFRYTIRRDLDNVQLKTGTSAAFSVVKGLAALGAGPPLELNGASFFSHAVDGAVYVSENLLVFVLAAVGLDYCFKIGILSPFPMKLLDSPPK